MKLNAKVVALNSGSNYVDHRQRVQIKLEDGEVMYNSIIVPNADGSELDEELVVLVMTANDADSLYHTLYGLQRIGQSNRIVDQTIDQLRPDPPPPFMTEEAVAEISA